MIERRFTKAKRSHERPGDGYVNVPSWPNAETHRSWLADAATRGEMPPIARNPLTVQRLLADRFNRLGAAGRGEQGTLAGAGLIGGRAARGAAVAVGVCAATAPVCVGAIAFVGGLLATYGAEASFGSLYPRPTR